MKTILITMLVLLALSCGEKQDKMLLSNSAYLSEDLHMLEIPVCKSSDALFLTPND